MRGCHLIMSMFCRWVWLSFWVCKCLEGLGQAQTDPRVSWTYLVVTWDVDILGWRLFIYLMHTKYKLIRTGLLKCSVVDFLSNCMVIATKVDYTVISVFYSPRTCCIFNCMHPMTICFWNLTFYQLKISSWTDWKLWIILCLNGSKIVTSSNNPFAHGWAIAHGYKSPPSGVRCIWHWVTIVVLYM